MFEYGIWSPKQREVLTRAAEGSLARLNILDGSVRSGKTVVTMVAIILFLRFVPKNKYGIFIGKSEKTVIRNILNPLSEMVPEKYFNYKLGGEGGGTLFGHKFYIVGAYDEKSYTRIQGMSLSWAYGDEVSTWPESFFNMLLSRLSDSRVAFLGTTNPDNPFHWLKKNFLDKEPLINLKRWHFTLDDNPNLPPEYVKDLKSYYTGLWYKRYIEGLWVLAEGVVYDMFDENIHVRPAPPNTDDHVVSIDYGTTNPTVFQMWGSHGDSLHLLREYYYDSKEHDKQKTDPEYADDLTDFLDGEACNIIIDPSAASFRALLQQRGFSVLDADNSVIDGIRDVSSLISAGKLFVDPSCTHTIEEFGAYIWDEKAGMKGEDAPVKKNDHGMDAMRYRVRTLPITTTSVPADMAQGSGFYTSENSSPLDDDDDIQDPFAEMGF